MHKLGNWLLTCKNTKAQGILGNITICPGLSHPETDSEAMKCQYPASKMYASVLSRFINTRDSGILECLLRSKYRGGVGEDGHC